MRFIVSSTHSVGRSAPRSSSTRNRRLHHRPQHLEFGRPDRRVVGAADVAQQVARVVKTDHGRRRLVNDLLQDADREVRLADAGWPSAAAPSADGNASTIALRLATACTRDVVVGTRSCPGSSADSAWECWRPRDAAARSAGASTRSARPGGRRRFRRASTRYRRTADTASCSDLSSGASAAWPSAGVFPWRAFRSGGRVRAKGGAGRRSPGASAARRRRARSAAAPLPVPCL